MKFKLSCFFHPTQIIALDDNETFLEILETKFAKDMNFSVFTNPQAAITAAQNIECIEQEDTSECNSVESDCIGKCGVNFNLRGLHKIIYNKLRFNYPSVILVDLHMAKMNGIEVCRNIKNSNLSKIIVTMDEDKRVAVEAFNENLIQKYLIKNDSLFYDLYQSINDLTLKYFVELSKPLVAHNSGLKKLLEDKSFIHVFNQIITDEKIIEYYLLDNAGSFVFLNDENEPIWLLIKSEEEYTQQLQMLEGTEAPQGLISSLENRERLLFLSNEQEFKKSVQQWYNEHTFPATKFKDKYYFSIVKGKVFSLINWEEVTFYQDIKSLAGIF